MLRKVFGLVSGKKGKVSKKTSTDSIRRAKRKTAKKSKTCEFC